MKKHIEEIYLIGRFNRERNFREHNPNGVTAIMAQVDSPFIRVDKDCEFTDIEDGVYLFKTNGFRTITSKGIKLDLQIVTPIKRIGAPEDDFWMPVFLKNSLYAFNKPNIEDWRALYIHVLMRIYGKHFDEVLQFEHNFIGEAAFLKWLFKHLVEYKDSLHEMRSFIEEYEYNGRGLFRDGEGMMEFDPRYDKLQVIFVPSFSDNYRYSSERKSIELFSSDIGTKMKPVFIESDEDIVKYSPYLVDGLEVVKTNNGYTAFYKMPERGSDEYWGILKNANINCDFGMFTINSEAMGFSSYITIKTPCGNHQNYFYGTDVYTDYLKLVGARTDGNCEVLDDDFEVDSDHKTCYPNNLVYVTYHNKYGKLKAAYKASQIFRLKGKCLNANIRKVGSTIDSLRIIFERK